jgi:hypothetical protein
MAVIPFLGGWEDAGRLDACLENISLLKHDARIICGHVDGAGTGYDGRVFVKRFGYPNRGVAAIRCCLGSRARKNFFVSLALRRRGLNVPDPLGYLDAPGRGEAYYFSVMIEPSTNLGLLYKNRSRDIAAASVSRVAGAMAKWHSRGAVHGDMKWSNILIRSSGDVVFTDLERARCVPKPRLKGIRKDLSRFFRFALELDALEWTRMRFVSPYREALSPGVRECVDMQSILESARLEWAARGGKRI